MGKSWLIGCCSITVLAAYDAGDATAQSRGVPGAPGSIHRIGQDFLSRGVVPPPFVVPSPQAVLPSASQAPLPDANPIGDTVNPPGLTGIVPPGPPVNPPGLDLARIPACL